MSRWKRADGMELVHTVKGRLLLKLMPGEGFTLLARAQSAEQARAAAERRGMTAA